MRFNNVFGYYIEISKATCTSRPPDYERKQTLANAERFTTPELKDYERKVLDAEEKILTLEKELFAEVRRRAAAQAQRIRATAVGGRGTGRDGGAGAGGGGESLSAAARSPTSGEMRIMAGRHPVIERLTEQEAGRFIPNDLYLNDDDRPDRHHHRARTWAASRTYLRQAALIAILAQMGSFVPAESALLPVIDRDLHAHRRVGQPGARPLDLHGGDDGDGGDPEHRDAAQLHRAGRNRPRHGDLRWAGAGVGGGGARPRSARARRRCSRRTITS